MSSQGKPKGCCFLQIRDITIVVEGFDLGMTDFPQKVKGKSTCMPWLLDFLSCPSPLQESAVSPGHLPGLLRLAASFFTIWHVNK